jgi:hypothetical protein
MLLSCTVKLVLTIHRQAALPHSSVGAAAYAWLLNRSGLEREKYHFGSALGASGICFALQVRCGPPSAHSKVTLSLCRQRSRSRSLYVGAPALAQVRAEQGPVTPGLRAGCGGHRGRRGGAALAAGDPPAALLHALGQPSLEPGPALPGCQPSAGPAVCMWADMRRPRVTSSPGTGAAPDASPACGDMRQPLRAPQVLVPRASWAGHVCGILAGVLYAHGATTGRSPLPANISGRKAAHARAGDLPSARPPERVAESLVERSPNAPAKWRATAPGC